MKISYNWLKDYVDVDLSPDKLSEVLTGMGLEVETMETLETIKGGLEGFVTGEVKTCARHPKADKLSVTTVDTGSSELLSIVCGAPNVAAGQKVIVAKVGAKIYKGEEFFEIKKVKLRGEDSEGMICAEDEIGIGTFHDGILVLPPETPVGMPAREYFAVESDTTYEIGLTPNRIDSGSHFGVARDLAAWLSLNGKQGVRKPFVDTFKSENNSNFIDIIIENPQACPRYAGVTVSGLTVAPSPEWLQKRLKAIGQNPINNVVDVTNFILHELGQPLHAFDADRITGKKVVVKCLPEETKFTTLDGVDRTLSADDLMICNATEGMAIGGVFGGMHSGITDKTKNIFIESAYFNPVSIRKTARRHVLATDASFHFERGTDPNMVLFALKRAALLITEIAGGIISSEIIDRYPAPIADCMVEVTWERMYSLIGKRIDKAIILQILTSLEIKIDKEEGDEMLLRVPPYRVDVKKEADIVEEILRIYGYNNVEFPHKVNAVLSYTQKPDKEKTINTISDYLSAIGFAEIISNSLTKSAYYENSSSFPSSRLVYIVNPLSSDLNSMRQTLIFGGLEAIIFNTNRKNPDLKLYEFGNCYFLGKESVSGDPLSKYSEEQHLALFITGNKHEGNWATRDEQMSFYSLKGYVQYILDRLGIPEDACEINDFNSEHFSEALSYTIKGKMLVTFGCVHPNLLKSFDIKNEVFYADFDWAAVMGLMKDRLILYREVPKYPEVKRDLSLLLDQGVSFGELKKLALEAGKGLIRRVSLFDVYMGDRIEAGKKSYALSFTLQDTEKTLNEKEIDSIMDKIVKVFGKKTGAVVR